MEQAAIGTHDSIKKILNSITITENKIHALDAPCGHGGISKALKDLGYQVDALDIFPPEPISENIHINKHDLNQALPYENNFFDICVSVEGIEHLDRPSDFLLELSRVLKSGGHLILSTPNPDSLHSRYRMFIKGYHKHFNPISDTERTSGHIHPIDRIFIERNRIKANLDIIEITTNRLYGKKFPWNLMSNILTRKLPNLYKNENILYGDVIVYHFKKK